MSEGEATETNEEGSGDASNGEESHEFDIIDSKLYGSLESYFEGLIDILSELAEANPGRPHEDSLLNLGPSSEDDISGYNERQAIYLSESLTSAWGAFPGYDDCVEAFKESEIYSDEITRAMERGEIDEFEDYRILVKDEAIPKLLKRYLQINSSKEFDKVSFKKAYSEFEDYLTMEDIGYEALAYLGDFEMENEELVLNDNLRIKEISDEGGPALPPHYRRRIEQSGDDLYAIEYEYSVDKFGEGPTEAANEAFEDVVLALRLYADKGDVQHLYISISPQSDFETNERTSPVNPATQFYNSVYRLGSEECREFSKFWDSIRSQIKSPDDNYRVALDKYSNSFERSNESDRLLDCVIALEALYLKSGEFQEMSYRLSQRGALLLAETEDEAVEIKSDLKQAYDLRSKLVHGSSADIDQEFVMDLHNLTRKSLYKFLTEKEKGNDHDDIIERLDKKASSP